MTEEPHYLIVGGEPFDRITTAPAEDQVRFLKMLRELCRAPRDSTELTIDQARDWGVDTAYIADFEGLNLSYHVSDAPKPVVVLIEVMWLGLTPS